MLLIFSENLRESHKKNYPFNLKSDHLVLASGCQRFGVAFKSILHTCKKKEKGLKSLYGALLRSWGVSLEVSL